jgi:hypothetical protein
MALAAPRLAGNESALGGSFGRIVSLVDRHIRLQV